MKRRMRRVGGTPVEEAPVWALGVLAVVLWAVIFPGVVGFLNGFDLVAGGRWGVAALSAVIAVLLVAGVATRPRWKRPAPGEEAVEAPVLVRFSTWFLTTLMVPNVLYGVLVLSRRGEGLDYLSAWLIGLMVSAIHGAFALAERVRAHGRRDRAE